MTSKIPEPSTGDLTNHFILNEMLEHITDFIDAFPNIDYDVLTSLLEDVKATDHQSDEQQIARSFLRTFRLTTVFREAIVKLDQDVKKQIEDFIDGKSAEEVVTSTATGQGKFDIRPSPRVKHHFRLLDFVKDEVVKSISGSDSDSDSDSESPSKLESLLVRVAKRGLPIIYEDASQRKVMEVFADTPFENWGLSVKNAPKYTFVPTTVLGIKNLVKYAIQKNLRVRCAGYRHSWSPTFSENDEILISLLNLEQVTTIPDISTLLPTLSSNATNELKTIELAPQSATDKPGKRLARVGVSVTNEDFRRWAVKNDAYALPVDVILVEVTCGGVNAMICHGGGRQHDTISDYVRQIDYIDATGEHRSISDPEHLQVAAGCFGLLGVVTHITFELDAMTYAVMKPIKPDICLAIPPLKPADIPPALRREYTPQQYAAATKDFENRAANDYYSEWFWFPYQQQAWVNTWNTTTDKTGVREYPATHEVWLQWIEGWIGGVIVESRFFQAIPGRWQAEFLATLGMASLPPQFFGIKDTTIKTQLPNALHFRRGIQNLRVRDMEYQIPIPGKASNPSEPDWTIVQRAWWDAINLVYQDLNSPMRVTLELRIMGSSALALAPQKGNHHGTASIEVLSVPDAVADDEWEPFIQKMSDIWMSYTDARGERLNVRPHWAKEWDSVSMGGVRARRYLKEVAYRAEIPLFRRIMEDIGRGQGWTVEDAQRRFSNELWDEVIFS